MNKLLYNFFTEDHHRIDELLHQATEDFENIDETLYHEFRVGLLTHIKMEETILFPAAIKANQGAPLPDFQRFRREHAALTTLVAVFPDRKVVKVLQHILEKHDEAEEKPGGMYDICENLTQDSTRKILERLQNTTPTPVHPPKKDLYVLEAAKRVVQRAGYDFDKIVAGTSE